MRPYIKMNLIGMLPIVPYLFLVLFPFKDRLRFSKKTTSLLIMAAFLMQCTVTVFAQLTGRHGIAAALHVIIYVLLVSLSVKEKANKHLFVLFVVLNYGATVTVMSVFIRNVWRNASAGSQLNESIFTVIVLAITLPFMWNYLNKQVRPLVISREPGIQKAWDTLWLIPAVFYVILYYSFYIDGNSPGSLSDFAEEAWNVAFVILLNAGYFLVYRLTKSFLEESQKNLQLLRENNQLSLMAKQYENIQERIEDTLRARHDIRHHMTVIDAFLKAGDQEGLKAYLEEYRFKLPDGTGLPVCENRVVDAVTNYYIHKAKEAGVQVEVNFCIPASLPVPETDFCSILGNLLENALEACKAMKSDQRFIRVQGQIEGSGILILVVENSYEGEIRRSDGTFLSSKRNWDGMGIASVTSFAEKNRGVVKIDFENNVFRVSVFLGSG